MREFILGAVIAPSLVCFAWVTILGGTSIDLELNGAADGAIIGASNTAKLFVTLEQILSGGMLNGIIIIICVVLIMTFLVTSADSGILVMNTIMSGGSQETGVFHRIIWGVILTLVIGTLPFTMIMVLMCISLAKAMWRDNQRDKVGAAQPAE